MSLELKIESLRARGELNTDERDRLLSALRPKEPHEKPARFLTHLRVFLLGIIAGVVIAYFAWIVFRLRI